MLDTLLFSYTLKGQQIKLNHADSKELSKAVPSVLDLSSKKLAIFQILALQNWSILKNDPKQKEIV